MFTNSEIYQNLENSQQIYQNFNLPQIAQKNQMIVYQNQFEFQQPFQNETQNTWEQQNNQMSMKQYELKNYSQEYSQCPHVKQENYTDIQLTDQIQNRKDQDEDIFEKYQYQIQQEQIKLEDEQQQINQFTKDELFYQSQ
ncbi:hypothetical protein PPERSA_09603 [Pseudocohnilembus persalinus]|uniref:Uncharacterized protein n=1 Tax=Pseudocohnilembus persalinus TaxID=266149 RepID=A0A0V0QFS3_PSEPJ|nr:hypothetical protein PPERSA_09603 [Pseudocohnilembus persalinus]|eukprot:KRX00997.1 hypothetical protein PPERSA_09603 [Pseudocohnilembus persalinus]